MCFSARASIITFLIGTLGSILLIYFGNPKFRNENITFGIFLIFISAIQLMDFFFWIDLKNKIGLNKIITIIGPLLNVGQPIILWLIKLLYFSPNIFDKENLPFTSINILYLVILLYNYVKFLGRSTLVTGTNHGHLEWPWIKYSNPWFYLILFAINIFYLTNLNYSLLLFSITYFFLILSSVFFKYNIGELWCFFGAFIPFIMFFLTKKENNL
jgi:hypothetical protein